MNILILTFSFPFLAGNNFDGKFVLAEAEAYAENGAGVTVVTPHYRGAPKHETMKNGVTIDRFSYFFPRRWQCLKQQGKPLYEKISWLAMFQIPFLLLAMAWKSMQYGRRMDIIHAQWSLAALLSLPAKWLFGTTVVLTVRGSDIRLLPVWLNRFIHRHVDAAIDCFGPQPWNENYKKSFPACYINLPLIVYTGKPVEHMPDDMAKILRKKKDVFTIVYIGRFEQLKISHNHLPLLLLIQVVSVLVRERVNLHLFYLGEGSLKPEMESLINALNLSESVTLLGAKTNVTDYLQYCHLGVGGIAFNAVSQEITMAGKPQLLVDADDNYNTPWVDGRNAIFIKPDDLDALVKKVKWASRNHDTLNQIAGQAQIDMEPYFTTMKPGGSLYLQKFAAL